MRSTILLYIMCQNTHSWYMAYMLGISYAYPPNPTDGVRRHAPTRRRYGKSEGKPTEEGLVLDVEASLRALRESPKSGVDPNKVILFGRSLGGAVALAGADRYPDLVRTGGGGRV